MLLVVLAMKIKKIAEETTKLSYKIIYEGRESERYNSTLQNNAVQTIIRKLKHNINFSLKFVICKELVCLIWWAWWAFL